MGLSTVSWLASHILYTEEQRLAETFRQRGLGRWDDLGLDLAGDRKDTAMGHLHRVRR